MTSTHASQPACLPEAIERIRRRFDPLRIILFGSWARGDARPDSDLDLLVVLPQVDNKRHAAVEILRTLNGLPLSKDVVVTTPDEIAARGNMVGDVLRPALRDLIPPGWLVKTEHPDLAGLAIWAVEARYPGDMPLVVEGDAQAALQTAEALVQSVAEDLQKHPGG